MASGSDPCPEHPTPTRRGKRYGFYDKHHRRGITEPAQWAHDLSHDDEFAIFDDADWHEFADIPPRPHLYGIRRGTDNQLLDLGAGGEQVAKFWFRPDDLPWHGFPLLPLASETSPHRNKPIPKAVLKKMFKIECLDQREYLKLSKGRHT